MLFNSVKQFEKYVLSRCKVAVANSEEKVHKVIDTFLKKYYNEFEPKEYIRTYQLLHSLVKSNIIPTGNGYEARVYFDIGALNYEKGYMYLQHTAEHGMLGYATWSGAKVLDTAMHGSHGGYVSGTPIWEVSMAKLEPILDLLLKELKAAGIPIC